jgi:hypothetical protein
MRAVVETPALAGSAQLVEEARPRGEEGGTPAIVRLRRDAQFAPPASGRNAEQNKSVQATAPGIKPRQRSSACLPAAAER